MSVMDLHIHTVYSDGIMSVDKVIEYARKLGLNGISITDHDTLQGTIKAIEIVRNKNIKDFIVIPGVEISSKYGHILVYGLTDIRRFNSLNELFDIVKEEGGIIALAHPYGKLFFLPCKAVKDVKVLEKIDAIEVLNGKTPMISNRKAYDLSVKLGKPSIGGSDAHMLSEIGIARTEFTIDLWNVDEAIYAIKKGLCKATGGRSFPQILASILNRRILHGFKRSVLRRVKNK